MAELRCVREKLDSTQKALEQQQQAFLDLEGRHGQWSMTGVMANE